MDAYVIRRLEGQKAGGSKTCQLSYLLTFFYFRIFVFICVHLRFPYSLSSFLFPNSCFD